MQSKHRARFEASLALIGRGARNAAAVLDDAGDPEAAWEFVALSAWAMGELDRSLANKSPRKSVDKLARLLLVEEV